MYAEKIQKRASSSQVRIWLNTMSKESGWFEVTPSRSLKITLFTEDVNVNQHQIFICRCIKKQLLDWANEKDLLEAPSVSTWCSSMFWGPCPHSGRSGQKSHAFLPRRALKLPCMESKSTSNLERCGRVPWCGLEMWPQSSTWPDISGVPMRLLPVVQSKWSEQEVVWV